jgi:hypothetical protein
VLDTGGCHGRKSLRSCSGPGNTAKTWERIVAERLAWWLDQCEAAAPLPVRASQPALPNHKAAEPSAEFGTPAHPERKDKTVGDPMVLARSVQADGGQRAIEIDVTDRNDLEELRLELRDRFLAGPVVDATRITHIRPWLWRQARSGGRPLSAIGEETGYEIRLSRYTEQQVVDV